MESREIEAKLGYRFRDRVLLERALTHPSTESGRTGPSDYERMEFLGDAVLELVVSHELYTMHDGANEGELTKMRAAIVSRHHLASIARELGIGSYIIMSSRLEVGGGRHSVSILGNTMESLVGAIMLDSDFDTVYNVACKLLRDSLKAACPTGAMNPKGDLQELLQSLNKQAPLYQAEQLREVPPLFRAVVVWNGQEIGTGTGSGKRMAETAAAQAALDDIHAGRGWARNLGEITHRKRKGGSDEGLL